MKKILALSCLIGLSGLFAASESLAGKPCKCELYVDGTKTRSTTLGLSSGYSANQDTKDQCDKACKGSFAKKLSFYKGPKW